MGCKPTVWLLGILLLSQSLSIYATDGLESQDLSIHPYLRSSPDAPSANSIKSTHSQVFSDYLNQEIEKSKISVITTPIDKHSARLTFSLNDYPVCQYSVLSRTMRNGEVVLQGYFPEIHHVESFEWPDFEMSALHVREYLKSEFKIDVSENYMSKQKCYSMKEFSAFPVWDFMVSTPKGAVRILVDDTQIYSVEKKFYDAIGESRVFAKNPKTTPLEVFQLELNGDGTLTNEYFVTTTSANPLESYPRAGSPKLQFIYSPKDYRFIEASAFTYAVHALNFFTALGYSSNSSPLVVIKLHMAIDGSPNNAFYNPSDSNENNLPSISLGDGDGINYQNFSLDTDIISHEFSHHVINFHLHSSREETSIIHEGLADFFAYAKSENSCLATSVCTRNSRLCMNDCLRSGDIRINYNDSIYKGAGIHIKSIALSGMLWELRNKIGPTSEKIVYDSLAYMVSNSGFKHLLAGIILADSELNAGKHACDIYDIAISRGFKEFVENIDCHKASAIKATVLEFKEQSLENPPTNLTEKDEKNKIKCGALITYTSTQNYFLTFLILLPVFLLALLKLFGTSLQKFKNIKHLLLVDSRFYSHMKH